MAELLEKSNVAFPETNCLPKWGLLLKERNLLELALNGKGDKNENDRVASLEMVLTVELQWLKHLWNHVNMFETGSSS